MQRLAHSSSGHSSRQCASARGVLPAIQGCLAVLKQRRCVRAAPRRACVADVALTGSSQLQTPLNHRMAYCVCVCVCVCTCVCVCLRMHLRTVRRLRTAGTASLDTLTIDQAFKRRGTVQYKVTFSTMVQQNVKTKYERSVRRRPAGGSIFVWEFEDGPFVALCYTLQLGGRVCAFPGEELTAGVCVCERLK